MNCSIEQMIHFRLKNPLSLFQFSSLTQTHHTISTKNNMKDSYTKFQLTIATSILRRFTGTSPGPVLKESRPKLMPQEYTLYIYIIVEYHPALPLL